LGKRKTRRDRSFGYPVSIDGNRDAHPPPPLSRPRFGRRRLQRLERGAGTRRARCRSRSRRERIWYVEWVDERSVERIHERLLGRFRQWYLGWLFERVVERIIEW
jgi:hypothetical protein